MNLLSTRHFTIMDMRCMQPQTIDTFTHNQVKLTLHTLLLTSSPPRSSPSSCLEATSNSASAGHSVNLQHYMYIKDKIKEQ